jgi:hypothetical protein
MHIFCRSQLNEGERFTTSADDSLQITRLLTAWRRSGIGQEPQWGDRCAVRGPQKEIRHTTFEACTLASFGRPRCAIRRGVHRRMWHQQRLSAQRLSAVGPSCDAFPAIDVGIPLDEMDAATESIAFAQASNATISSLHKSAIISVSGSRSGASSWIFYQQPEGKSRRRTQPRQRARGGL